jgi:23S rRNA (cytosine1962-C5)-methyltransferase
MRFPTSNGMENIKIWVGEINGYKLLDSGDKKKLEEIGGKRIVRNEPRAWWKPEFPDKWKGVEKNLEAVVEIGIENIKTKVKFKTSSKHIGIFPEQAEQWRWIFEKIKNSPSPTPPPGGGAKGVVSVLNLFGYTGIVSLIAAKAGAKVAHVDASKQSVDWARENQKLSGLENAPIRWILDDVVKFLKKEIKRGVRYDAIIMDPPSYGRGPDDEVWKIEEQLPELLEACREILSDQPLFIIFNMYSTELSSLSVANLLADMTKDLGGQIESGELAIRQQNSERLLPMSIFAIWKK